MHRRHWSTDPPLKVNRTYQKSQKALVIITHQGFLTLLAIILCRQPDSGSLPPLPLKLLDSQSIRTWWRGTLRLLHLRILQTEIDMIQLEHYLFTMSTLNQMLLECSHVLGLENSVVVVVYLLANSLIAADRISFNPVCRFNSFNHCHSSISMSVINLLLRRYSDLRVLKRAVASELSRPQRLKGEDQVTSRKIC